MMITAEMMREYNYIFKAVEKAHGVYEVIKHRFSGIEYADKAYVDDMFQNSLNVIVIELDHIRMKRSFE